MKVAKAVGAVLHLASYLALCIGMFSLFFWAMSFYGWPQLLIWIASAALAVCFGTLVYRFVISTILIVAWLHRNALLKQYLKGMYYGE